MNLNRMLMLLARGQWGGVYCDAPDSGAGAGANAQSAATQGGDPAGGAVDPGDGQAVDDGGAGDDDDALDDERLLLDADDDEQATQLPPEEQLRRMRKANRRLRGRYLKARDLARRVDGVDLDDLVTRARQFDELRAAARTNPTVRAALFGDARANGGDGRRRDDPALPALPTAFTAADLGFDPAESQANRVLAAAVQHVAVLSRQVAELARLAPTVQNLERTVTTRTAHDERTAWESEIQALTTELRKANPNDPFLPTLASDAMWGAFAGRASHGKSAKQIREHYIRQMQQAGRLTKRQAGQVSAGTQSRMATNNRTLPRSPAGGGAPASAQGNQRPTLKDVHRRLRLGQIGPR